MWPSNSNSKHIQKKWKQRARELVQQEKTFFALHTIGLGSVPNIPYSAPFTTGIIPESKPRVTAKLSGCSKKNKIKRKMKIYPALFIVAKEERNNLPINWWRNKKYRLHAMEYYLTFKGNEYWYMLLYNKYF